MARGATGAHGPFVSVPTPTPTSRLVSAPAHGQHARDTRHSLRLVRTGVQVPCRDGRFALRECVVNFRTSLADIESLPPLLARVGREADQALRG